MDVYISVKNFGIISEARVNISSFTVFVGNNNSGKTQLMELIYTIIKHVSALTPSIEIPQIRDMDAFHIGRKEIHALNEFVNDFLAKNIHEIIDTAFNTSIPIESVSVEFIQVDQEYDVYFLTDRTREYLLKQNLIAKELYTESLLHREFFYRSLIIENNKNGCSKREVKAETDYANGVSIEVAKRIELGNILAQIMGGRSPDSSNVLFLPASRMGLMLLYKHYFGNVSQDTLESVYKKNQNAKGITKPVLDFLSFLLKYSYTDRSAKKNEDLISFIFERLIDGKISEKGDVTLYTPMEQKTEIPVFAASSMVNEVVPVIKALTDSDFVDFIFYDEVETSMHPLKQIEMVKLLNRLTNNGIKLLVSTHSDTMASKINNLLLLSQSSLDFEKTKQVLIQNGIQIEKEDLLDSDKIHVYQFVKEVQGKSTVTELQFQKVPCTGFDFRLFHDSMMSLFEEAKVAMGIEDED